jgi:hypothetical protein
MVDGMAALEAPEPARAVGSLGPVAHRNYWIAAGLLIQLAGAAAPVAMLYRRAKSEDLLQHVTGLTVKLVWHQAIHDHEGRALIIAGTAVFVLGSMVLARPFVKHLLTLVLAVPLAALVFVAALGVVALIVVIIGLILVGACGLEPRPLGPRPDGVRKDGEARPRSARGLLV